MANEGEEAVVRGWREEEMQKGRVEGGKGGTGGYGIENEVVEEERRKKIEAGHRRAYEGLVEEMTKRREGGHEVRDGMRAKKGRRRMIEGPAPGAWEAGEDEEDEDVVEEVDKNVVDKEFIMELKRIREADAAEENRQREEEKKELERGRAMEAETSGRGRKRKGR